MSSLPHHVWMNGHIVPLAAARISPFDLGFTIGDGVFETLVDRGHGPVALHLHWRRLNRGCEFLGLTTPSETQMHAAFRAVMEANQMHTARLRFTVARGEPNATHSTMIAVATALHQWPVTERVRIVPWKRNPHSALVGIKSLSYGENVVALTHAKATNAGEAIFANTRDELCEGSGSNVFIIKDNAVITPPLDSGCLPGVTRELVIKACQSAGLDIQERAIPMAEFRATEEAFLTSSTRDVHPISHIDDRELSPAPGKLTQSVQEVLLASCSRSL